MRLLYRILICVGILLSHLLIVFPVAELFLVYIILFNPPWFRDFLDRLSKPAVNPKD